MKRYFTSKQIGIALIVISILLIPLILSFSLEKIEADELACEENCGVNSDACPHEKNIPLQSYLSFTLILVLAAIGIYVFITDEKHQEKDKEKGEKLGKILSTLKEDERSVYEMVKKAGGTVFQSELIETTGFTKVKISRILDRLEGRELIERRRRGMTNVVILK